VGVLAYTQMRRFDKEARHASAAVMGHFIEFSEKFCLQNKSENKDVNLSVAWWGKTPASYITTAQHGFFTLPANLKMDPGNAHAMIRTVGIRRV
jgi:hypothetical protein